MVVVKHQVNNHCEKKNEIIISTLYQANMWSWIIIVLAHWNNSSRVNMSLKLYPDSDVFDVTP